jgi:chemotaxis protein methyltransferase CheR
MTATTPATRYLAALLEARTGQQVSPGRYWRIESALKPLLRARGIETLSQLVAALAVAPGPDVADQVVEALLNNETSFFRDQAMFDMLQSTALAQLRPARTATRRLRIWCVGCSTGQEAYSLAMMFADAPRMWGDWSIDMVATDVSATAIAQARAGTYSQFEIQRGLSARRMMRWFEPDGVNWRVKRELARRIHFKHQNLLDEQPSLGRFDIILCRNVLLYFSPERRRDAFARLAGAIAPDGWLALGAGETAIGQTDAFLSDHHYRGLYRPAVETVRAATSAA